MQSNVVQDKICQSVLFVFYFINQILKGLIAIATSVLFYSRLIYHHISTDILLAIRIDIHTSAVYFCSRYKRYYRFNGHIASHAGSLSYA